jgi:four helix bundle protein
MFLHLPHSRLDVYKISGELLVECYRLAKFIPIEERFNLIQQLKRAALSVKLNIAEGCSRRTATERKRYFEMSRGSVVELDTAFEVCVAIGYFNINQLQNVSSLLNRCYGMLTKLIYHA